MYNSFIRYVCAVTVIMGVSFDAVHCETISESDFSSLMSVSEDATVDVYGGSSGFSDALVALAAPTTMESVECLPWRVKDLNFNTEPPRYKLNLGQSNFTYAITNGSFATPGDSCSEVNCTVSCTATIPTRVRPRPTCPEGKKWKDTCDRRSVTGKTTYQISSCGVADAKNACINWLNSQLYNPNGSGPLPHQQREAIERLSNGCQNNIGQGDVTFNENPLRQFVGGCVDKIGGPQDTNNEDPSVEEGEITFRYNEALDADMVGESSPSEAELADNQATVYPSPGW